MDSLELKISKGGTIRISKEKNNEILKFEFTPEKWALLHRFVAMTTRLNSFVVNVVYIRHHSNKFRLVQRTGARRAHAGERFQSPTCPLHCFCTLLAFALGSRANASVAIPA